MSNHLAIATVTAALGNIVHTAAKGAVPGTAISYGRPPQPTPNLRTANVYLYQAVPYGPLRNEDLPQRNAGGQPIRRPRAAIALHYLLSFHGDDGAFEPSRMLGAVVRDLHAAPQLMASDIADAATGNASLADTDLADGPERVKFSPIAMTLDDLSRLWSVMIQTPYSLSMAWQAEVVLIDALVDAQGSPPVLRRGPEDRGPETTATLPPAITALWFGITGTEARRPPLPSMTAAMLGATMRIAGSRLGGSDPRVEVMSALRADMTLAATPDSDGTLLVTLPADAAAAGSFAAGAVALRLAVTRDGVTHRSAVTPLLLAPSITSLTPNPIPSATTSRLDVGCLPSVLPTQRATLRLGALEIAAKPVAAETATLSFDIDASAIADGTLAILTIDGVASQPVTFDAAVGAFAFDEAQRVHVA